MPVEQKLGTGALPSPADYRDTIAIASIAPAATISLPSTFNTPLGSVLMQSQQPACVSHSIVYLIRLYWYRKTGKWIDFSPRFLDILSAEPDIPLDGGRRPRTVLKIAASIGCATTATLPNDVNLSIAQYRDPAAITDAARAEAAQYKIPGYIRVQIDQTSTRIGIFIHGAISTLFTIGDELWMPDWADKDIDPLRTPTQIVSGHQMTPHGWDNSTLNRLRNSWSTGWANGGDADYAPASWLPYTIEQWAVADIPTDVADFLKQLPKSADFHYQWTKNLHQGDENDDVRMAQIALLILGYMPPFTPDEWGVYGPKTAAAVLAFQSASGISPVSPADIGPLTRAKLNAAFTL
ncbi:MAG TPA: peptidoglycan-binding protein [Stellaceae bacterium]|jgi:hypothetical protein|nr:peptidoglycan-binding protein [Stellaceae bacterium]